MKDRSKMRSKTFPGIAKAIAEQWAGKNTQAEKEVPAKVSLRPAEV